MENFVDISGRTPAVVEGILSEINFSVDVLAEVKANEVTKEQLGNITYLGLWNKDVEALKKGDFAGLYGLRRLDLMHNELEGLPEGVFAGLENLKILGLHYNNLGDLSCGVFWGLESLEYLYLQNSGLTKLPKGIFKNLANVKRINLYENKLSCLGEGVFDGLDGLEELDLSINPLLKDVDINIFKNLLNLTHFFAGKTGWGFTGVDVINLIKDNNSKDSSVGIRG